MPSQYHWARTRFHIGDEVVDERDPRHVGKVEAIRWTTQAVIRFEETNWVSHIPVSRLRPAREFGH